VPLVLESAVTQFAEPVEEDGTGERVAGFALVEVGGTGGFRPVAYPSQGRAGGSSPDAQQGIEPFDLIRRQITTTPCERLPALGSE